VPVESLPRAAVTASAAPSPIAKEETDDGEALAAESAILDVARSGIARGEPEPALEAVGRHQRRFPHGLLTEEREALAIRALLLAARDDEAHARASRFRAAYPGSMFWPSLEAKLDGGK
jgi:RNA polymerase sigma-70 factor (ECF subfamily)